MKKFRLIKESSSSTSLKSSPISSRPYSDHPACHFRKFGYPKKSDNFGIRLHWRHARTFLGIFLQGSPTLAARGSILANMRYLAQKGDCHDQAETKCKKNPQVLAGGSNWDGQDKTGKFTRNHYWEMGYHDEGKQELAKLRKSMKEGDRIAIKSIESQGYRVRT